MKAALEPDKCVAQKAKRRCSANSNTTRPIRVNDTDVEAMLDSIDARATSPAV